jgi:MinD superfamily P-loop ATPase
MSTRVSFRKDDLRRVAKLFNELGIPFEVLINRDGALLRPATQLTAAHNTSDDEFCEEREPTPLELRRARKAARAG